MNSDFKDHLSEKLDEIKEMKLYKNERVLTTPQGNHIETEDGKKVLNFCSNNYIGFANNDDIKKQLSGVLSIVECWERLIL